LTLLVKRIKRNGPGSDRPTTAPMNKPERLPHPDLADWLPASLREIEDDQKAIPRIAKDAALIRQPA
jgi:hypothetical protein